MGLRVFLFSVDHLQEICEMIHKREENIQDNYFENCELFSAVNIILKL